MAKDKGKQPKLTGEFKDFSQIAQLKQLLGQSETESQKALSKVKINALGQFVYTSSGDTVVMLDASTQKVLQNVLKITKLLRKSTDKHERLALKRALRSCISSMDAMDSLKQQAVKFKD